MGQVLAEGLAFTRGTVAPVIKMFVPSSVMG